MEIKVEVEIYSTYGRRSVDVVLTDEDLLALAEKKVLENHSCDGCKANRIELIAAWRR